jgi:hypothetical protein
MARAFALWTEANLPKPGVIHRFRPLAHEAELPLRTWSAVDTFGRDHAQIRKAVQL